MADDRPICMGIPASGLWSPDIGREVAAQMIESQRKMAALRAQEEAKRQDWLDNTRAGREQAYEDALNAARKANSPQQEKQLLQQIGWNPQSFFAPPEPPAIPVCAVTPVEEPPAIEQASSPSPEMLDPRQLRSLSLQALRSFAAIELKIVGASKIRGGKEALIERILKVLSSPP